MTDTDSLATRLGAVAESSRRAQIGEFARYIARSPLAMAGVVIAAVWLFAILAAPLIAGYDPLAQSFPERLQAPSAKHWFGTDSLGRDVFARVLHGGRISIPVGFAVIVLATVIGATVGAVAGFVGGWVDELFMRVADVFLAFPPIILALSIAAALGPDLQNALLALVVVWWPQYARMMRGVTMSVKENEYVLAARALGASPVRTLLRAVLPNAYTPVLVLMTIDIGQGITSAAALSYLGFGVRPPAAEWGAMVAQGAQLIDQWWLAAFAGLAIMGIVMSFNFIGDAVRDALDPRLRHSRG